MGEPRIIDTADLDDGVTIGDGSSIWHLSQVRSEAVLGQNVVVGRGAYIGEGVHVGDNCKIQNYALVYEPRSWKTGYSSGRPWCLPTTTSRGLSTPTAPSNLLTTGSRWV